MMLLKSWNQLLRFHRSSYDSSTRLFFCFFSNVQALSLRTKHFVHDHISHFLATFRCPGRKKGSGEFQAKTADQSRHTAQVSQEI